MANRYWVSGGTGNWNNTSNWSTASGGTSGASVPGSSDIALLDSASGSGTVTLDISPTIQALTCTGFTGTLAFGTNTISLNSTGTIFIGATTMTVTGTPLIIATNATATARTISPTTVTEANSISFRITAGTGTLSLGTNGVYRDLDFTDGVNPTGYAGALGGGSITVYGNFKASTGMTQSAIANTITFAATSGTKTINTAGVIFDRPFAFNGIGGTFQLASALTSGATRTATLFNGTLDLASYTLTTGQFSSNQSNVRTLAFGTGKIVLTGSAATVFTTATATNLTITGTSPLIQLTTNATTGTRVVNIGAAGESSAISVDVAAGSDQVNLGTTSGAYRNVNFTGFTGTYNAANSISVFGNWNFGGTTAVSGTGTPTFAATSGTKTITSNGVAFPASVTFNGVGGTWSLQDAFTLPSTATLALTNGTLTTNGWSVTTGIFASNNSNTRTLNLGASTVTITGTGTPWNITDPTNITLNAGTSSINLNASSAAIAFAGGGLTYYNVTFGTTYYNNTLSGANTFNNLTVSSPAAAGRRNINLSNNQIVTGTLTMVGSAANSRPRITGVTGGTTITAAAVSLSDADFNNITAAGAAISWTGTRLGNVGGNTNITFATPKTVYWNQPAGGNWSDVAWATSSGGSVGANNFPLPQDTAILDNAGVGASSTIVMDYGWAFQLNGGSLTNALTINWNCFGNLLSATSTGNFTLSSAVTITYTSGALGFNSLASLSTITTAGVSIPIATVNFNSAGNTLRLADNFTSTGTSVGLVVGTLDLNGKTLSCVTFDSTFTDLEVRSIAFNGGQINVTGNNATVWACEDLTNFSYTGTPTVNFTYSGSTGTRTINNGSTAGLTEANAVDINIAAGSDIVGMNNNGGCRNYTVQPAFTGQTGLFAAGFVYGNLLLSPNQTVSAATNVTTFAATSGTKTITTNGVTIDRPLTFNGVGGAWALQDALAIGATRALSVLGGTFSTNNYNIVAGNFISSGTSVRAINLGSSTITISGNGIQAVSFADPTNLTLNSGTSTFDLTNTSATKFFQGGGLTFYKVKISGNSQTNINGGNSRFQELSNTAVPLTISFGNLTNPMYFDNFLISGTAGNLVTLQSPTPGTQFMLAKNTGGKVLVSYVSITDSAATPAGYWFAPTSQGNVNNGNNTGWDFGSTGGITSGFFPFF